MKKSSIIANTPIIPHSLFRLKIWFFFVFLLFYTTSLDAQNTEDVIRCTTVENEQSRLGDKYAQHFGRFEEYINRQRENLNAESSTIYTIPVVFHIIHDNDAVGTGDNIATQYIEAQLEQLNNDFRKIMGTSGDGGGVDTRIEFCAAVVDENGNMLAEPGINRIDRNDEGWTAPPYGTPIFGCFGSANLDYIDNTIKPQSQWDPEQYMNIWVLDIVCGILGYAQFPEAASLSGIGTGNGPANSDGVVVLPSSVGSTDNPQPGGAPFNAGRTLTHEVGHFFGLRHIWGDGNCSVDDFCADTPNAGNSTSGCPTGKDSCPDPGVDQIENYMDYTDDECMERFTQDQTDRMLIVIGETGMGSPRREILTNSMACNPVSDECPDDLEVNIAPMNGDAITPDIYRASNTITSRGVVEMGTTVTFEAGQSITLGEDFAAENGSTFTARIEDCSSSASEEQVVETREEELINQAANNTKLSVFPNPFSNHTTVEVVLEREDQIAVQLYDITGKQVAEVLPNSNQLAGKYQYEINANSLETGIYILRVRIGAQIQTRKLSVLK
ncbi:MAG: M43 family zinc metalloprotease [Bacteroidota bacterium]